jgi:hypothetical protein
MASEDSANFVAGYELQSFLLIVRTDRIVTNVALLWGQMRAMRASSTKEGCSVASDTRSSQHLAGFIDSAVIHCLTTF